LFSSLVCAIAERGSVGYTLTKRKRAGRTGSNSSATAAAGVIYVHISLNGYFDEREYGVQRQRRNSDGVEEHEDGVLAEHGFGAL